VGRVIHGLIDNYREIRPWWGISGRVVHDG